MVKVWMQSGTVFSVLKYAAMHWVWMQRSVYSFQCFKVWCNVMHWVWMQGSVYSFQCFRIWCIGSGCSAVFHPWQPPTDLSTFSMHCPNLTLHMSWVFVFEFVFAFVHVLGLIFVFSCNAWTCCTSLQITSVIITVPMNQMQSNCWTHSPQLREDQAIQ